MSWRERVDALWSAFDEHEPKAFVAAMRELVAELDEDDPVGLFELAGAYDSTGQEARAEQLYRRALALELPGPLRRQAVIQLASTVRNLGKPDESVVLIETELARTEDGPAVAQLRDCALAFLALALADLGQERQALSLALTTLSGRLPRYQRSLAAYAEALVTG